MGWPVVSLFTLCVAASMAELASAYPTAGGLYFWAFRLGGKSWAWTTAWLNMIGQVTITAGINIAAAIYLIGAVTRIFGLPADVHVPVFGSFTNWYFQLFVMVLIMIPQVLINIFGIRLTARLNDFSVWWHIGGVVVIAALLTFFGNHHNPLGFLFSASTAGESARRLFRGLEADASRRRWCSAISKFHRRCLRSSRNSPDLYHAAPFALVFVLGLLQAQWTYTGYDASAHMAEETVMARMNSAWGVFLSVAVSAVVGYVLLLILTWCIPDGDVATTANDAYPVLQICYSNLAPFAANVIAVIIGGAMWLCGCSSITSMARMWYAFARDDGMPGSRWHQAREPASSHAGLVHPDHQRAGRADLLLRRGVFRRHFHQHDHALPRLRDSDLPQLAQQAPAAGRIHHAANLAVEPGPLGTPINVIAIVWTIFITSHFQHPAQ